jgi:hypothetical protein
MKYYDPDYRCKYNHDSPRITKTRRCWICDVTFRRAKHAADHGVVDLLTEMTGDTREKMHSPILPEGCKPKQISGTLSIDSNARYHGCDHYMACLAYAWNGLNSKRVSSWVCSRECKHWPGENRSKGHSVGYIPMPNVINTSFLQHSSRIREDRKAKSYGATVDECERLLDRLVGMGLVHEGERERMITAMLHDAGWGRLGHGDREMLEQLDIALKMEGEE